MWIRYLFRRVKTNSNEDGKDPCVCRVETVAHQKVRAKAAARPLLERWQGAQGGMRGVGISRVCAEVTVDRTWRWWDRKVRGTGTHRWRLCLWLDMPGTQHPGLQRSVREGNKQVSRVRRHDGVFRFGYTEAEVLSDIWVQVPVSSTSQLVSMSAPTSSYFQLVHCQRGWAS